MNPYHEHENQVIRVPARPGLRPTPDRVRETLFNWLGQDLTGLVCLDLFAGSGALGFEAASRGAARVVMPNFLTYAAMAIAILAPVYTLVALLLLR